MYYVKHRDFAGKPFYFGPFDTEAEAADYHALAKDEYPYDFVGIVFLAKAPRFVFLP